ncbi:sugar nucleotide-binding protein [Microbulbifer aggregans]|uniref:sugar nucleotide-binding protein n=1 Tax=Microbulbifer aggregans TaxID=1769779 RepID=UPI001CFE09BF|nr:sugar nucleotide-binding protein [Microbulbifer aggregans]
MPMLHTGYQPDTIALIGAGNAIDSALQKGLQRVGFRVQLLGDDQLGELRKGTLVVNAAACGGGANRARAEAVCRTLPNLPYSAVLHLSSYCVLTGGGARKKIDEDEPPAPESDSGRRWLACEDALADAENVSILRLGWLVDRSDKALLGRVVRAMLAGRPVALDDVSRGNPVTVSDLVRVVTAIVQQLASGAPRTGIYHYGSADTCTAMEFGCEVLDRVKSLYGEDFSADLVSLEADAGTSENTPHVESRSVVLSCLKVRDVFGIQQRSWRQGLTRQVELWLERLQKADA